MTNAYDYSCGTNANGYTSPTTIYGIKNETGATAGNFKQPSFYFINTGSTPSGNATAKLFDDTDTLVATSTAVDMSVVTATSGTGQSVQFTFSSTQEWLDNYTLGVEFTGSNLKALGNYTSTGTCPANTGFQSRFYRTTTGWSNTSDETLQNAVVPSVDAPSGTRLPPPPAFVRI